MPGEPQIIPTRRLTFTEDELLEMLLSYRFAEPPKNLSSARMQIKCALDAEWIRQQAEVYARGRAESKRPLPIRRIPHAAGLPLPSYATAGAAGMDLHAAFSRTLARGERALIRTGFAVAVPPGHELQIRPRSGLALKHGITIVNTPGTIDEDYRGEIGVILLNTGRDTVMIQRGDRIAQAVLAPVVRAALMEVDALDETARGAGGFGSTGTA